MKKTKRICGLLLTFTLALFVLSCGGVEKEILGKWFLEYSESENDAKTEDYLEFFSDNTMKVKVGSTINTGTWTILDDGRLKAEGGWDSKIDACEIKIEGDKMELDNGEQKLKFTRAK